MELKDRIITAWANRELLKEPAYSDAVRAVIEEVDKGRLRTASPSDNGWQVNEWVKQAILLYFGIQQMETYTLPPFEFYDKMKLKRRQCIGFHLLNTKVKQYGLLHPFVHLPAIIKIGRAHV